MIYYQSQCMIESMINSQTICHDHAGCYNINVAAVSPANHKAITRPHHHFHRFLHRTHHTYHSQRLRWLWLDLHCLIGLQYLFTEKVRNADQYRPPNETHWSNHSLDKSGGLVRLQYSQLSQISGSIIGLKCSLDVQMVAI